MWLSGQQKRPPVNGEGQTGTVTLSEGELAVLLDSERRGLEVYSPAGYRWNPKVDERVMVIQGKGEIPAVVGTRQGDYVPDEVTIEAKELTVETEKLDVRAEEELKVSAGKVAAEAGQADIQAEGKLAVGAESVAVRAAGDAVIGAKTLDLQAQVLINGMPLEDYTLMIVAAAMG